MGAHLPLERLSLLTQLPHCLGKTEGREHRAGRGDPGPGRAGDLILAPEGVPHGVERALERTVVLVAISPAPKG